MGTSMKLSLTVLARTDMQPATFSKPFKGWT